MKSMASAILESTGPLAKFPRTIFFSMKAGINQKLRRHDRKKKKKKANPVVNVHAEVNLCSIQLFFFLPVCGPSLVEDSGIAEWIAQHQWVHSRRLVCVLCKLLRQESTQRGSEQMDLKIKATSYLFCYYYCMKSFGL